MKKNINYANRGAALEEEINLSNNQYKRRGIANIQKIATPVKITKVKGAMIEGFVESKSTLDFRGTVNPGIAVSFDCKENKKDERGLPLSYIQKHQIQYMREALEVKEVTFLICYMAMMDKRYFIPGEIVIEHWNTWQQNKGKRGYNYIPVDKMIEVKSRNGIIVDYLEAVEMQ